MSETIRKRIVIKSRDQYAALNRLRSFLDKEYPKLARLLVRIWNDQQNAITYKELRDAILRGDLTVQQWQDWQSDYAVFFNTYLREKLINAYTAGGKELAAAILSGADVYAPGLDAVENWVTAHGAELVTRMSSDARDAVSTMVQYTTRGNISVDELARLIRPIIGLTQPQSLANIRYYENMVESQKKFLMEKYPTMRETTAEKQAKKKAADASLRYASRQHRYRASMIAQTELAFAYNRGADDAVKQAVREGLLPKMIPKWITARDEAVCPTCGALNGKTTELGGTFDFKGKAIMTPPAHPNCHCAIAYVEEGSLLDW